MPVSWARIGILAALITGAGFSLAGSAGAMPWDQSGTVPLARTPAATRPDPLCLQSYANDKPRPGPAIRFGIGPRLAGESGAAQATPLVPVNPAKRDFALKRLAGKRSFTVRLNRLFMADGERGIDRFKRMARHYSALGFKVELQVRYHPYDSQNGNIGAWLGYVKRVVRAFGPIRGVTALQITNEVNINFSPNTSDGFYRNAIPALVRGVKTAKREARRSGHRELEVGFNYAWRFGDAGDAAFWSELGRQGGKAFRHATDWVGIDLYPGTFVPAQATVRNYGDVLLEALAQVRECYLPLGGFGRNVPLRIEETGWPTGPGRSEPAQKRILRQFVKTVVAYRGAYGITDFRWFGLRDNNSRGPNFQSYFGLLDDAYRPKPAFGEYRRLVRRYGRAG